MPDLDVFVRFRDLYGFFRMVLAWTLTVYFVAVTAQSLWGWYVFLSGRDRYTCILRRYLVLQALRLRFRTFWGELLLCALLGAVFFMLWHAQSVMDSIEDTLQAVDAIGNFR